MKPARIVSLVIGSLLALVGFGLLAGGGILGWALATQRDDAGYFTTSNQQFMTDSYALTSDKIDLGDPGPDGFGDWANAMVRVRVDSAGSDEVFVGIAREADVEAFLAGVPHDDITTTSRFGNSSNAECRRENVDGTFIPAQPATQTFWVAQASGIGTRGITWHVESGSWAILVMNANGTPNVTANVQFGGQVDYLVPIAIGLALAGFLLLAVGAVLIVVGVARPHARDGALVPSSTTGASLVPVVPITAAAYPLRLEGHLDPSLSRWQWLVKWFLAIPQLIIVAFLTATWGFGQRDGAGFLVSGGLLGLLVFVAALILLFTGRYPPRLHDLVVGINRWIYRVIVYAALMTDQYPPFHLDQGSFEPLPAHSGRSE